MLGKLLEARTTRWWKARRSSATVTVTSLPSAEAVQQFYTAHLNP